MRTNRFLTMTNMSNADHSPRLDHRRRRAAVLMFRGKTQAEIAQKLGVSNQTVCNWAANEAVMIHVESLFSRLESKIKKDR